MNPLVNLVKLSVAITTMLLIPAATPAWADTDEPTLEELSKNAQSLTDKLQDYTAGQREDAIRSIRETLKALDERIAMLDETMKDNWDDMSDVTRENARKSLQALRAQREKVAQWYERLKESSSTAWSSVRKDFSEAYDAFSEAWLDAEDDVENETPSKLDKSI